ELRGDPARPRFASADRQVFGRDAGQLEAGSGLRDRAVAHRCRGDQEEVPEGLQGAETIPAHDAAAAALVLTGVAAGDASQTTTANARTSPVTYVPRAPTKRSGSGRPRLFPRI